MHQLTPRDWHESGGSPSVLSRETRAVVWPTPLEPESSLPTFWEHDRRELATNSPHRRSTLRIRLRLGAMLGSIPLADVAQLVERLLAMQKVDGSSPFIRFRKPRKSGLFVFSVAT